MEKTLKEILMYVLGGIIVIGFFVLLFMMLYWGIPEGNKTMFDILVGALVGSFTTIVGYFYGSSKGSADKNELIKPPPNATQ
jgi:uncharacterized BrkB/YihY/UPF0761 family membrane protein